MRRYAVLLVATLGLVGIATPAGAIHKGVVCQDFNGPDGPGNDAHQAQACLLIDDHDFEDKIRGFVRLSTGVNSQGVTFHVSYLRLIRTSGTVRDTGPFVVTLPGSTSQSFATTWLNNPSGIYHSRIRIWACWHQEPGDPCGNILIWNSNDVGYI